MLPMKGDDHVASDLQKRMSLFVEGQITWPAAGEYRDCTGCRLYAPDKGGKGRCTLIKKHYKKPGKLFFGKSAIRCGKFEAAQ